MTFKAAIKLIRSFGMAVKRKDAINTAEVIALHASKHGNMSACGRYPVAECGTEEEKPKLKLVKT